MQKRRAVAAGLPQLVLCASAELDCQLFRFEPIACRKFASNKQWFMSLATSRPAAPSSSGPAFRGAAGPLHSANLSSSCHTPLDPEPTWSVVRSTIGLTRTGASSRAAGAKASVDCQVVVPVDRHFFGTG
jgi:hypothetical protein